VALTKCKASDFDLMGPSAIPGVNRWVVMSNKWTEDAEPGEWVRRRAPFNDSESMGHLTPFKDKVDTMRPEGIVVSVLHPWQVGDLPERFIILWFK
jgi:hypothetical protein